MLAIQKFLSFAPEMCR